MKVLLSDGPAPSTVLEAALKPTGITDKKVQKAIVYETLLVFCFNK